MRRVIVLSILVVVPAAIGLAALNRTQDISYAHGCAINLAYFAQEHSRMPLSPEEFEAWQQGRHGEVIYPATFMKAHLEPEWGEPLEEVPEEKTLIHVKSWRFVGAEASLNRFLVKRLQGVLKQ